MRCNMTFSFRWHHWHHCQCHIIQPVLVSDHMKPMISSMAQFHTLDQDDQNEVQHDLFFHVMPLALALSSVDADGVINGTFVIWGQDDHNKVQHDLWSCCHWNQHHMTPMAFSVAHANDGRIGTSTGIRSHIIPLINHLNTTNAKCHWWCHLHHVPGNILMSCMCQKLIYPTKVTYMPHISISSCVHITQLCQYICLIWTHCH